MKLKSLLFASSAGLMIVSGAQAADLPTAEPVEYVRICDAFGTGFFYIPGTDTCLKIDGYARYEAHWVGDSDINEYDPFSGRTDDPAAFSSGDNFNNFTTRARGQVNFDARTMTDLGLLRSYISLRGTIGPEDTGGYSDGFNIDKAWLSLAGDNGTITAGHHGSFFDFFGGKAMNSRIGGDDPTTSTNTLAYTFAIGNGVSASVAIEDKWFRRNGIGAGIYTTMTIFSLVFVSTTASGALFSTGNEGQELPDFVANIRVDQGWGSAQIMGAVGRVGVAANTTAGATTGVFPAADEIGWAVGAGLSVGVPGTGISFDVQGTWAEGLVAYSTTGNGALLFDAVYTVPGGVGFNPGNGIALTETWAVQAALGADVSSNVSVSLDGAYASIDHNGTLRSEDYDTWILAGTVHWKPVSGLTVSGEVAYESIDPDSSALFIPDDDIWGAMMRINRTF